MKKGIPCKVCGEGVLKKRKRYRMSGIVVLIGYIFLIPSIFGMAIGAIGLASTPSAVGGAAVSIDAQAMEQIQELGFSSEDASVWLKEGRWPEGYQIEVSEEQESALSDIRLEHSAGKVGWCISSGVNSINQAA